MVSGTVMTYLFKKIQKGFSFLDFCTYSSTIWSNQPDIDKVYLHSKDPYEGKYQLLINKLESAGLEHCNDPKGFIENSNDADNIHENIDEYKPNKKCKILFVFDMIAEMLNNKKCKQIVTDLLARCTKMNISHVFITQLYFAAPKIFRLNYNHYFIMKILNKLGLQQIVITNSSEIDCKRVETIF